MEQKITKLEDIIQSIPEEWTVKEKARKAYLVLGENSFYNTIFNHLFGYPQIDIFDEPSSFSVPNIGVCKKFTEQYMYILRKLGIKCREQRDYVDDFGMYHPDAVFVDEDGNEHLANLAVDLPRIQSHSSTKHFAEDTITPEELRQIDLKTGYITPEHGYTDDYFDNIREFMSGYDLTESERVDMMFRVLPKFFDVHAMGDDEQAKTLRFLMKRVFGCNNSSLSRSYNSKEKQEDYYIKSFNEAKPGVPPHSTYLLFNKEKRTYEEVDSKLLVERGILKGTEKYY